MHVQKNKRGCYKLKIKKKPAMVLSFALGSILFASTAFAEVNSKDGYVQMKDALKYTAESVTSKLSSYTMDTSMIMKDNGNIISSNNSLIKYDVTKGANENKSTNINEGKTRTGYSYVDKNVSISFNDEQNVYYVNQIEGQVNRANFTNPFKQKQAGDMEKIADALVGNLKDSVVVTQNTDGTKQISGTISEAQIPAIANAVVSYGFKSRFGTPYMNARIGVDGKMPKIADDLYVKEVKGSMTLDKDGLIQSVMGTGLLSGKDDKGKEHSLTFELLVKISDVNKTVVNKPDLTGKKVETYVQKDYNKISKPEMYLGSYKNDIIIEKDGKFQKIGERFLLIVHLDDKNIAGSYHEEYVKGNEGYSLKVRDFKFDTKFEQQSGSTFNSTDSLGNKVQGNIYINPQSASVNFNIKGVRDQNSVYTGDYNRIFN